jgi:hypothetical protein
MRTCSTSNTTLDILVICCLFDDLRIRFLSDKVSDNQAKLLPKFHLLFCHLVHAWRELGHPLNYSTAPYEHKQKPAKEDYRSASNNGKRQQMIKRMEMR